MAYDEGLAQRIREALAAWPGVEGTEPDARLRAWVERGATYAASLPPK